MSIWERLDAWKVRFNRLQEGNDAYEKFYGLIDYQDKRVIDIGAEVGTTANYFLSKGAREVFAYEVNPILKAELERNFSGDPRVHVMERWRGEELPFADILKIDCEMCEYMLSESQLQKFEQWAVAVHRPRKNMPQVLEFQKMLLLNGGTLIAPMGFEVLYLKVNRSICQR